jgi:hypothetical protein
MTMNPAIILWLDACDWCKEGDPVRNVHGYDLCAACVADQVVTESK